MCIKKERITFQEMIHDYIKIIDDLEDNKIQTPNAVYFIFQYIKIYIFFIFNLSKTLI